MKIPCDLYFMKDGVRGELIGSFEDIEAAQAYIEEVCTKIPLMDGSSFCVVRLANGDKLRIRPCPVCNNENVVYHQLPPNLGGYGSIHCKKCGLELKAKAIDERYVNVYGDYYRKYPAKSAFDAVVDLWNAMAGNY